MSSRTAKTPDQAETVVALLLPATVAPPTSRRAFSSRLSPSISVPRADSGLSATPRVGNVTIANPEATCTAVNSIDTSSDSSDARTSTSRSPAATPFSRATETRKPLTLVTRSVSLRPESSEDSSFGVPGVAGGFKLATASEPT